ncbi:hypothetical protein HDV00_009728 [Rhizophlyctis rosea]|nr:hypothetical protein HDV00_009728 [Rhizophlyctis rosea]
MSTKLHKCRTVAFVLTPAPCGSRRLGSKSQIAKSLHTGSLQIFSESRLSADRDAAKKHGVSNELLPLLSEAAGNRNPQSDDWVDKADLAHGTSTSCSILKSSMSLSLNIDPLNYITLQTKFPDSSQNISISTLVHLGYLSTSTSLYAIYQNSRYPIRIVPSDPSERPNRTTTSYSLEYRGITASSPSDLAFKVKPHLASRAWDIIMVENWTWTRRGGKSVTEDTPLRRVAQDITQLASDFLWRAVKKAVKPATLQTMRCISRSGWEFGIVCEDMEVVKRVVEGNELLKLPQCELKVWCTRRKSATTF